jgi:hypothetical protein
MGPEDEIEGEFHGQAVVNTRQICSFLIYINV